MTTVEALRALAAAFGDSSRDKPEELRLLTFSGDESTAFQRALLAAASALEGR